MNQYNGFTPRAAAALEGAQRAAQQAGHTYIGSEHLLLALLREGAGAAYTLLFQRRVTAGKTERALLQMVGRGHPTLLESEETTVHYRAAVEEALREAQMGGFLQAGTEHLLLALMRKGMVDIPLMFALGALFPMYGLVWATPAADIICCIAAAAMFALFLRQLDRAPQPSPLCVTEKAARSAAAH